MQDPMAALRTFQLMQSKQYKKQVHIFLNGPCGSCVKGIFSKRRHAGSEQHRDPQLSSQDDQEAAVAVWAWSASLLYHHWQSLQRLSSAMDHGESRSHKTQARQHTKTYTQCLGQAWKIPIKLVLMWLYTKANKQHIIWHVMCKWTGWFGSLHKFVTQGNVFGHHGHPGRTHHSPLQSNLSTPFKVLVFSLFV